LIEATSKAGLSRTAWATTELRVITAIALALLTIWFIARLLL
jgi:hypothetical protein